MTGAKTDHRVQVAERRRENTRQHLLAAIKDNMLGPDGRPARVEDIARAAGVSKRTFYKYFNSLDEAASELGASLARQMVLDMEAVHKPLAHPVHRVAMGCQLFLYRAICDRKWAAFVGHVHSLSHDNLMHQDVSADLSAGRRAHWFDFEDLDSTADFILGATFHSIRRIATGDGSRRYVEWIATAMLRALGADEAVADEGLRETAAILRRDAPGKLAWWDARLTN